MLRRQAAVGESLRGTQDWVVVGRYAFDGDADLTVSLLQAHEIPAVRFPVNPIMLSFLPEPVRVLVPPEREEEARELLRREGESDAGA